jgi:hypothetical protein
MKIKSTIIALALAVAGLATSPAQATENPTVESFTFTPTEIDLLGVSTKLDFELIVSHPFGIENLSSFVTIKDSRGSTWGAYITRIESPVNPALKRVTYKGSLTLPRTLTTGVYSVSTSEVKNNSTAGYSYGTGAIVAKKIRDLIDAENSLLVRSGSDLNYEYTTFQGPSYDTSLSITYKNPTKYNSNNPPIWKVGETFNPSDYYEQKVSALALQVKTTTPTVCSSDGKTLKLIAEGSCSFTVFTAKTNDFALYESKQTVQITSARIKSVLFISKIDNQTSKDLPKSLTLPQVYSAAEGYVLPKTTTPAICVPVGFTVRLISGGVCTLTYETAATSTYLASDVYQQTFEIVRDPQTITFTLPSTANVSSRSITLAATASSGAAITYSTASTGICSITGSTLNLLGNGNCAVTATQAGTSILAPASATATVVLSGAAVSNRKTITCVKGKSTKKVSGVNPKCPKGFKIKR